MMKTLLKKHKYAESILVTILMIFVATNIVYAQGTLVTNINQPYTWYDEFGQKSIDLPDWLDGGAEGELTLFEFVTLSAVAVGFVTVGTAYGGFGGFALGAFIGKKVGPDVADLTPEIIESVATDINNFLGIVEDTYDRHTIPFGIWNGTLAQEFTTGSNRHGYDLSSVAIYGRFYPDSPINTISCVHKYLVQFEWYSRYPSLHITIFRLCE